MTIFEIVASAIWDKEEDGCEEQVRALIATLHAEGYKIVPKKPTKEMWLAIGGLESVWRAGFDAATPIAEAEASGGKK